MVYISLLSIVLIYLVLEKVLHRRRLRLIPLRIHVNGTRGKTTVTCLTAELLRRAGIRTLAKTTGDHPVLILADGRPMPIRRWGPARIHEQMRVVRRAAREGAQAVVLECMALEPHLQEVSEQAMVHAGIGVITNVRPDHFEIMGSDVDRVADALSCTIPNGGALVTESGPYEGLFRERAGTRGAAVCVAEATRPPAAAGTADPILLENLALVRAVGLLAGLPSVQVDDLLQGMAARGAQRSIRYTGTGSRRIGLIDAFSANDTVSTARVQAALLSSGEMDYPRPVVALLNTRADRPLRTLAFAEFIAGQTCYQAILLAGDGGFLARRHLRRLAVPAPIFTLSEREPSRLLSAIARQTGTLSFTLVGMGNHRGAGEALRRYFAEGTPCS
ncbi:MAG: poly-gamma-glutamate synthase PgsB [Deltaproteobacteria bacterium]|nr:poly-gamma-glutamate synthase PgsB [Deltaproteobacteria bacterium]